MTDRSSMTARLANVLYWTFSGLAALLLLSAILILYLFVPGDVSIAFGQLPVFLVLLACPALLAWLIGRACHYVLGGDASALWERALLARARRSPAFRNSLAVIALISIGVLGYGAWSERERNRIPPPPEGFTLDRQAAAAAPAASAITAADLSLSNMRLMANDGRYTLHGTVTNNSKRRLESLTYQVTVEDCQTDDPKLGWDRACRTVGQEQTTTFVDIPPGQTRELEPVIPPYFEGVQFANMPPEDPQRMRLWTWKIISVKAVTFDPSTIQTED